MTDAPLPLDQPCDADCPVRRAARVLDGKWTTLIVRDLISGTKRFSELQRSLTGISPRMLSARLAMLETEGLISKTIYPTVPPRTEYALTTEGWKIEPVIRAMYAFGLTLAPAKPAAEADRAGLSARSTGSADQGRQPLR